MPNALDSRMRRFAWDASRRAARSGRINGPMLEHALQLHIAGRYEDAITEIERIPEVERSAAAWRILGHAEHGRGNHDAAVAAHLKARHLHGEDREAASDDEVNLAAVFMSMKQYVEAWAATERARQLAPDSESPWLPRISILNRQGRSTDLELELRALLVERPDFVESARFRDHLENDTDFIGVGNMIARLKPRKD